MELLPGKGIDHWVEQAHQWFMNAYTLDGCRSFYLPAGQTPVPLYQYWQEYLPDFLGQCRLLQIDDVMTGSKKNLFSSFFKEHLSVFQKCLIPPYQEFVQAEAALLGLGRNGHLGFHEPGLPIDLYLACVPLEAVTCDHLKLEISTWGLTYGLKAFMNCKKVLLLVRGKEKQAILREVIKSDSQWPHSPAAYLLHHHPQVTILYDQEADPFS